MHMDEQNVSADNEQLKKLNQLLVLLVVFIVVWTIGMVAYVEIRTEPPAPVKLPVVTVDMASGKITNSAYANLFPRRLVGTSGKLVNPPVYEQKESYQVTDFVVINYFFVEGLIVEKRGENYTIMYKDHNSVLQQITVHRDLLMAPAAQTVVNPAALISP